MGAVFVFRTHRVDASERVIKWRYLMDMKNKENYNNKNKNQKNGKSERKMRTSNAQKKTVLAKIDGESKSSEMTMATTISTISFNEMMCTVEMTLNYCRIICT